MFPLKVKTPVPFLIKLPEPVIVPEKVLLFESPAVKICEAAISIAPEPSNEAIVSDASTSYVPLEPTLTTVLFDKEPVTFKVPALIVVVPLYEFVPDRVKIPVPAFVNPPEPAIDPEISVFALFPAVKVWEFAISIVPAPAIDAIVSEASTS